MDLINELKKNPFVLAPMAGITDCAFRSFVKAKGNPIVISELVSANGLKYSSEKTKRIMKFDKVQHPVGIQIFGEHIEHLVEASKYIQDMGADFVDLNFGCPVPKVVKRGAGSAILKDLDQLKIVLKNVKSAIDIPLTIKIRTGWDNETINSVDVAHIAYNEGVEWVAIHGRTRAQAYSGLADWDYLKYVKSESKIPIIGNGDIMSAEQANTRLSDTQCDGVMIGRGCLKNPWIFNESIKLYNKESSFKAERNFIELFNELMFYLEKYNIEKVAVLQLKKFASWFSHGYTGSAKFRRFLFEHKTKDELLEYVLNYYNSIEKELQSDTSTEAFLMGGHG